MIWVDLVRLHLRANRRHLLRRCTHIYDHTLHSNQRQFDASRYQDDLALIYVKEKGQGRLSHPLLILRGRGREAV